MFDSQHFDLYTDLIYKDPEAKDNGTFQVSKMLNECFLYHGKILKEYLLATL